MLSSAPFIAELPQDLAGKTASLVTVHGRYGNNALNGDWELGITSNTSAPPQQQVDRIWKSGTPEPFTFAITKMPASLAAPAATSGDFTIGGSNVKASYTDIASYEPNAIKIWARSTTTGSGVTINDLKIKTPGVTGETVFPGTVINVSQDLGPVFQEIIIAGIDFKSTSGGSVTLEGNVAMQFRNAPVPRGSSVQFHVIATHIPWVDLDVDSNNDGKIDLTNGRRGTDDPIEDRADLPGVIVPVGGTRTKMVVHVASGRTATLAFAQGVDMARVYAQETGGDAVLEQGNETTTIVGGPPQTFWIEAFAPSASLADIAFTLTADTNGPPVRDVFRATAVAVNLDVSTSKVDEDGSQGLIYTFTRSVAMPTSLTIAYDVGVGTATEGIDYTGLPLATGGRSITIPANATTASVAVFPILDTEIEYDETVVLTLLPGAGYGLGTRTVATGTILDDDYFLDLVLDGLPEESAPPPNELSPGALLPIGGGRKRLDIVVDSPGNAGTITLTVLTGADKITLWDAETGGQQVQPGAWQVGEHPNPRTLWVKDTGIEGDIQLVAMFHNRGQTKEDAVNIVAAARPDIEFDATKITAAVKSWMNGGKNRLEDNSIDVFNLYASSAIVVDQALGTFRSIHVKAQAIDDPAIGREHAEDFFFQGKQTLSGWSIFRGADHNPGGPWNWLRDYHPGVGVSTPADFKNLPDDQETYWETEFEKWSDPRITAQRMTGTLDVTYVYAGNLDPAAQWIRRRSDFDLAPGAPTPLGHEYPYPRPLNVDFNKSVQNEPHHAVQPAGWDLTSTLTLHFEFTIDLENDVRTLVGTWAIDDIDSQSNGRINVNVEVK